MNSSSEYSALFAVDKNIRVTEIELWNVGITLGVGTCGFNVANLLFPNKAIIHSFTWPKGHGYLDTLGRCGDDFVRRYFEVREHQGIKIEVFFGGEAGQDYSDAKMHLSMTKEGDVLCVFERGSMTQVDLRHFGFRLKIPSDV